MNYKQRPFRYSLFIPLLLVVLCSIELVRPYYARRLIVAGLHRDVLSSGSCPQTGNCSNRVFDQLTFGEIHYKGITTDCVSSRLYVDANHAIHAIGDAIADTNAYHVYSSPFVLIALPLSVAVGTTRYLYGS